MKTTKSLTILALAGTMLATGFAVTANAEDRRGGMRDNDRGASFIAGERFARADTNGDRVLSAEEFQAQVNERFATADADGDGLVTPQEMAARAAERMTERAASRIERIDTDGDGALSLEEMQAASAERFTRMDRNEDGELEPRELRRGFRGGDRDGRADRDGKDELRGDAEVLEQSL